MEDYVTLDPPTGWTCRDEFGDHPGPHDDCQETFDRMNAVVWEMIYDEY